MGASGLKWGGEEEVGWTMLEYPRVSALWTGWQVSKTQLQVVITMQYVVCRGNARRVAPYFDTGTEIGSNGAGSYARGLCSGCLGVARALALLMIPVHTLTATLAQALIALVLSLAITVVHTLT